MRALLPFKETFFHRVFAGGEFAFSFTQSPTMSTDITSIGNFIVKELVGQGSFSEVYNCVLPDCPECVFAIKRLLSTCSSKKIVNEVISLYLLKVSLRKMAHSVGLP